MKFDFFKKRDNKSRAATLQGLRKERLKTEGKAKLIKLEEKEKDRISKARETIKQDSPLYKARAKLKTNFDNQKKRKGMKVGGGEKLRLGGKPGGAFSLGGKMPKP